MLWILIPVSVLTFFLFTIVVPMWKLYVKAGQPGWKMLIPIYNVYVMTEIAGLPRWTFLGIFVPILNLIVIIIIWYHVSQRFGHGMGYALGSIFLPFIFLPIIGYGDSVYTPSVEQGSVL